MSTQQTQPEKKQPKYKRVADMTPEELEERANRLRERKRQANLRYYQKKKLQNTMTASSVDGVLTLMKLGLTAEQSVWHVRMSELAAQMGATMPEGHENMEAKARDRLMYEMTTEVVAFVVSKIKHLPVEVSQHPDPVEDAFIKQTLHDMKMMHALREFMKERFLKLYNESPETDEDSE